MLIPFSLELRDITQETEYVMTFDPCDELSLTEVVNRGQQIYNQ